MPTVVNCRRYRANDPAVFYCARPWAAWTESSRDSICDRYYEWLSRLVDRNDLGVRMVLGRIQEDSLLGCWCAPKRCHCDEIIKVWRGLR